MVIYIIFYMSVLSYLIQNTQPNLSGVFISAIPPDLLICSHSVHTVLSLLFLMQQRKTFCRPKNQTSWFVSP